MSTVEVSLFDNCILQWKQQRGATASDVDAGWLEIARVAADLDNFFMLADLTEATRPQGKVRSRLRRNLAALADRIGHIAFYTGSNAALKVAIQFAFEGVGLRSYSVHETRQKALETIIAIRGEDRTKEDIARLVVEHLLELHAGRCPITDEAIEAERDPALQEVLTAMLCLYEGQAPSGLALNPVPTLIADVPESGPELEDRASFFEDLPIMLASAELPDGRITDCNPAFERALGHADGELQGRTLLDLIHPKSGEDTASGLLSMLQNGSLEGLRMEMQRKDGSRAELCLTAWPVTDASGHLRSCRIVAHDPEVSQDERSFKTPRGPADEEHAETAKADIEELACQASHDLQEPLRRVSTYADRLREHFSGMLDDKAGQYIDHILDGITSMRRLVSGVLDYGKIGQSSLPLQPMNAAEPLRLALANLRGAIDDSGAQVLCAELPLILGDESQLVQLFQNLVGNAIKYGGRTQGSVCVSVSARRSGYKWEFSVRDNGAGMGRDQQQRIFELFGGPALRSTNGGSGLGLAIAKRVVERHGGQIWIESELGSGTTVFFTLPAASTDRQPHDTGRQPHDGIGSTNGQDVPANGSRATQGLNGNGPGPDLRDVNA